MIAFMIVSFRMLIGARKSGPSELGPPLFLAPLICCPGEGRFVGIGYVKIPFADLFTF
jgi:hypothetical protein